MFLRIVGAIVLITIIIFGYIFVRDKIVEHKLDSYSQYAGVIAETSIAATLYRNSPDSFMVARDSILKKYDLTMENIDNFREKMQKKPDDWRIVFDMVAYLADSLIDIRTGRAKAPGSGVDSSTIERR